MDRLATDARGSPARKPHLRKPFYSFNPVSERSITNKLEVIHLSLSLALCVYLKSHIYFLSPPPHLALCSSRYSLLYCRRRLQPLHDHVEVPSHCEVEAAVA